MNFNDLALNTSYNTGPSGYRILSNHELSKYDVRNCCTKVIDLVATFFRWLTHWLSMVPSKCFGYRAKEYHQENQAIVHKENNKGLCVFIHGLNGHPAIWNNHLDFLSKKHVKCDTYVPFVPHAGNCTLEEAADPLCNCIVEYIKEHPLSPVCLVGISNGGRIALYIETQLRQKAKNTSVKISTLAAVHFGTSRMNMLQGSCLRSLMKYKESIVNEISYESDKAKALLEAVVKPLESGNGKRSYEFYATSQDTTVPELGSSLPLLDKGEAHYLVHGCGHDSIASVVAEAQMTSCTKWMVMDCMDKNGL